MKEYLLFIALFNGFICYLLALYDIAIIRRFILDNQGQDNIPVLKKNDDKLNTIIRNFRKKLFSKEMDNQQILSLRKKIRLTDYLSIIFVLNMLTLLYFSYQNAVIKENKTKRTHLIQRAWH